ncbi:hypothetical protein GGX14DRAFT_567793 [Mycena pura]|uniref:Uncharacterized protein n=1 Tax=Mycena pura TaxID=153505 RepID=A0AAD6Y8J4_9AGAR|nr:hypothetical protein GGX14DRAFT_567793 [Mycena pura]
MDKFVTDPSFEAVKTFHTASLQSSQMAIVGRTPECLLDLDLRGHSTVWGVARDSHNSGLKMCFIWEFGAEDTKTAGVYGDDRHHRAYAYQDIKVNQKSNALCLTHLAFDTAFKIGGDWSDSKCGFTIYDTYGNSGKFHAACSSDHDGIDITNAN